MNDENNDQNESPDGDQHAAPTVESLQVELEQSRTREQKAVTQRRELGAKLDGALQRNTELEAQANPAAYDADASRSKATRVEDAGDAPAWALELKADVGSLRESIAGDKKKRSVELAHTKILKDIPDGNKEQARLMLDGMAANGLDFTSDGAVDTALKQLQTTTVMFDPDRRSPRSAPPIGPDDEPDFSGFKSWDDIPISHRGRVPDDVAARLSGRGTAGKRTDGHLI